MALRKTRQNENAFILIMHTLGSSMHKPAKLILPALFWGLSAHAQQADGFGLSGFVRNEWSVGTHQASPPAQPCYGDSRGVLGYPGCGAASEQVQQRAFTTTPLLQLTGKGAHEFDSGVKVDAVLTQRWRDGKVDIVGQNWYERNVGIEHPEYGTVRAGTQLARSWSRQDAFSYPVGLSSAWSETGAGFSVLPQSLRYTSPQFEVGLGKLTLEATYATNDRFSQVQNPAIPSNSARPQLGELFAQYSDEKNLIEVIFDTAKNAGQSSWGKNPLVGAANFPLLSTGSYPTGYPFNVYGSTPKQNMLSIMGNHWFTPQWMLTWGVRRSHWSGQALVCDYSSVYGGCVYQGGFNISPMSLGSQWGTIYPGWSATETDALLGLSHTQDLWTYTGAMVYLGRAQTANPSQWGQGNSAQVFNFGAYRKVPELMRNFSVYGGVGAIHFDKLGPAPISMPSNTALSGVDPRINRYGYSMTVGALLTF
jgi:hypothetical protein